RSTSRTGSWTPRRPPASPRATACARRCPERALRGAPRSDEQLLRPVVRAALDEGHGGHDLALAPGEAGLDHREAGRRAQRLAAQQPAAELERHVDARLV